MSHKHGLITSQPVGKDLVFGAKRRLGGLPLNPGGQWHEYLPKGDAPQNLGVETEGCASAGTLHATEMLLRKTFNNSELLSYRFLAKISGTTHNGNDPHFVAETLRHYGCVESSIWPYTPELDTWEKFYADIPAYLRTLALQFVVNFSFGHEYVKGDPASMKAALEYSPLGVAVWAWGQPDENGIYRRESPNDDHWCVCYGYVEGQYWKVFDSYTQEEKKLAWDFGFKVVKRYTLQKQVIDSTFVGRFMFILRYLLGLGNKLGFRLGLVGAQLPSLAQLAWGDPVAARHSARVVMDAFNLSWKEKDLLCAVIAEESGFKNTAVNENRRSDGTMSSTDWGICQINDRYHIGPGLDFPSVDYLIAHPEEAVAFMVRMYRSGHLKLWCAFSNGSYQRWMPNGIIK